MDLKLPKMLCKDSKQHHVMFHELNSVSSLLCIAQNVRFEIPYKDLYFETPFLIIFKCYAWVSCAQINTHLSPFFKNYAVSMVQSTNCIIILVPIPPLPKPEFLTALISCKHSCRFSSLRNTGYPMRKLTIHCGNRPPIKRQGKLPLTQHNITPLLYKTQLSKQITFTEA